MSKTHTIIRRTLLVLLSFAFIGIGVWQLMGKTDKLFHLWGYPDWFVYVVGTCQILFALGLYYTKMLRLSAFGLTVILICAVLTHAGHHEFVEWIPAGIMLCVLFGLMYLQSKRAGEQGRWGFM